MAVRAAGTAPLRPSLGYRRTLRRRRRGALELRACRVEKLMRGKHGRRRSNLRQGDGQQMRMGAVVDGRRTVGSLSGGIEVVAGRRHNADLRRCCNYRRVVEIR